MRLLPIVKPSSCLPDGQAGFTLVEIMLAIAIVAILAGITIIAASPNEQTGLAQPSLAPAHFAAINNLNVKTR